MQQAIVPHRIYRPSEIAAIIGGSAAIWRKKIAAGEIPSISLGYGAARRHRAVVGSVLLAYLTRESHGEESAAGGGTVAAPAAPPSSKRPIR